MKLKSRQYRDYGSPLILVIFSMCFLFLTGCVAYFEHPLTPPGEQPLEEKISGTWFWNEKSESGFIHIGEAWGPPMLTVLMVEFRHQKEIKVFHLSGHTSAFDDKCYLNLKWVHPENSDHKGYMYIKYQKAGNHLGISLMNTMAVKAAVKTGSLQGKILTKEKGSLVHVSALPETLQKLIKENDQELFKDTSWLKKLQIPARLKSGNHLSPKKKD